MRTYVCFALSAIMLAGAAGASAGTLSVGAFGDGGWMSDDTRLSTGTNLVGLNNTHYGKPGQTPTAADDANIADQIEFLGSLAGTTYPGAVRISGTTGNSGKSTISTVNLSGFAPASDLVGAGFSATYKWYMQPEPTQRTLAFRFGIQSTQWGTDANRSQEGFTASRSGESAWDLVLVNLMDSPAPNAWNTVSVSMDSGNWYLYGQAGSAYWLNNVGASPGAALGMKTLEQWQADAIWGPVLFGEGAQITSIQFGLGSAQRECSVYVDYLQTSVYNGGDVVNFIPEPATLVLLALGGGLLARGRRRRAAA